MHERRYKISSILGFKETRVGDGNGRSGQCESFVSKGCKPPTWQQHQKVEVSAWTSG